MLLLFSKMPIVLEKSINSFNKQENNNQLVGFILIYVYFITACNLAILIGYTTRMIICFMSLLKIKLLPAMNKNVKDFV